MTKAKKNIFFTGTDFIADCIIFFFINPYLMYNYILLSYIIIMSLNYGIIVYNHNNTDHVWKALIK
jgi:hypothetical protein